MSKFSGRSNAVISNPNGAVAAPESRVALIPFQIIFSDLSKSMLGPAPGRGDMTFPRQRLNRSAKGTMESKAVGGGHF